MIDMHPLQKSIQQIMPATGWKVWICAIEDDGSARFWEAPVIGWGIVRHQRPDDPTFYDELQLFIFDEDSMSVIEAEENSFNVTYTQVGPNEKFDADAKYLAEKRTRKRLENQKKAQLVAA
jgi:hypothetical protein